MECVLFVDDDKKICDITSRYIRDIPLEVVCAFDGSGAAAILETRNVSLIILDVMLPDTTGFDFLEDFRAGAFYRSAASTGADTPVIMLTALSQTSNIVKGLRLGADDYIVKPYNPQELVERIRTVLKRSGRFVSDEFSIGNIRINLTAQKFFCGGKNFEL
ncbi:MAG: response regulator transcription factor [Saccharofermentanales bacterium]